MTRQHLNEVSKVATPKWARYAVVRRHPVREHEVDVFFCEGDIDAGESPGQVDHIPCPSDLLSFVGSSFSVGH